MSAPAPKRSMNRRRQTQGFEVDPMTPSTCRRYDHCMAHAADAQKAIGDMPNVGSMRALGKT